MSCTHNRRYFHDEETVTQACKGSSNQVAVRGQTPHPLSASSSSTAEPSKRQASQSVGHICPKATGPACPGKGKRQSRRSRPNPHPSRGAEKTKRLPNPCIKIPRHPSAGLLRRSLCLSHVHPSTMLLRWPTENRALPTAVPVPFSPSFYVTGVLPFWEISKGHCNRGV